MDRKNKSGKLALSKSSSVRNHRGLSRSEKRLPKVEKKWVEVFSSAEKPTVIKSSLLEKQDKLNHLKRELNSLWLDLNIPDQHRTNFLETLGKLPFVHSHKMIDQEIKKLRYKTAPILVLMNSIQAREDVLFLLKQKIEGKFVLKVEASDLIRSLRINSLEVVEALQAWRSQVRASDFTYKGEVYTDKMRHDYLFVLNSSLLNQPVRCNTFFNLGRYANQSVLKVPSHLKARIKSAENFLSTPTKKSRRSRLVMRKTPKIHSANKNREIVNLNDFKPDDDAPQKYNDSEVHEILQAFLESVISQHLSFIVKDSYDEVFTEISSSVLNDAIENELAKLTHALAYDTFEELNHIEYTEIMNKFIESEINRNLPEVVSNIVSDTLIYAVLYDLISELPYQKIVKKAIREENNSNLELLEDVYNYIFDSMMKEDWIEILVEEQVGEEELDKLWHLSPPTVQHQIMRSAPQKFRDRLADVVYFDILNSIVGDLWTSSIAENYESEDLKTLMPIPDYEAQRKVMRNSLGLGLSLWRSLD